MRADVRNVDVVALQHLDRALQPHPTALARLRQSWLEALLPRQGIDLEKVVNILPRPDIVDDAWKLLPVFEGKANQPRRPILLQPLDQPLGGRVVVEKLRKPCRTMME